LTTRLGRRRSAAGPDAAPEPGTATTPASALDDAEALVREDRIAEAVDLLVAANRAHRDAAIEVRTLQLRQDAVHSFEAGPAREPWPPVYEDPFPEVEGRLPEIGVSELTTDVLGGAVAHHGALIVRNLIEAPDAARIIDGMHRTEAQRAAAVDAPDVEGASWYRRFPLRSGPNTRPMVEERGGIWLADSPANTALVLDLLVSRGIIDAVAGHLGERPCFSLQKSTLRHIPALFSYPGWHQDGAFLGADVRTMNVWVALSPCGGDRRTPSLEIVPRRLDEILVTEGGLVPHSIDPDLLARVAAETPPVLPVFDPGDGLLFDERLLHSTHFQENMTDGRYALECWLFAPSHRSSNYLPFLV